MVSKKKFIYVTPRVGSGTMSADLAGNVKTCLNKLSVRRKYAWSGSTTVFHWLKNNGEYETFNGNRVSKIKAKSFIEWKYAPTKENPAYLGSRVCEIC